jgi:glycosyltransferase involved in cell wall biosynthesis
VNNSPLVSIIINCFNGDRFLKEAIDSIYNQSYPNWEIIFWDNASSDNSSKIALSYDSRIKYYLSKTNTSLGEARKAAIEKVSGKYISFLDCDDVYFPLKLEKQVSTLERTGRVLTYTSTLVINEKGNKVTKFIARHKSGDLFDQLLKRYEIAMGSAMILKEFVHKHHIVMDQKLKYCPDFNYFMIIASKGEVDVIPEILFKYRKTKDSLTKNSYSIMYDETKQTLDLLSSDTKLFPMHKASFDIAYKLLNHLKAIKYINSGEFHLARKAFSELLSLKYKYRLLYLLLFTSLGRKLYIKLFFNN